jgi:hypothetical protein
MMVRQQLRQLGLLQPCCSLQPNKPTAPERSLSIAVLQSNLRPVRGSVKHQYCSAKEYS